MAASVELPVDATDIELEAGDIALPPPTGGKVTVALSDAPTALVEDTDAVFELPQLPVLETRALAIRTAASPSAKFPRGPLGLPATHWKQDPRVSCNCTS